MVRRCESSCIIRLIYVVAVHAVIVAVFIEHSSRLQ
jgi:hypothetical protein